MNLMGSSSFTVLGSVNLKVGSHGTEKEPSPPGKLPSKFIKNSQRFPACESNTNEWARREKNRIKKVSTTSE